MSNPIEWGVKPLAEQERFAALVREVTSQVLSLEQAEPALGQLLEALSAAKTALTGLVPSQSTLRIGEGVEGHGRVFIDHCRDIGAFNPMFPVYTFTSLAPNSATGTVNFPIAYEGPAGCLNGGFIAVFFDTVVQQHNCELGLSGATRDLDVKYRRPTPLLVDLTFAVSREVRHRDVFSEVTLLDGERVLCSATTNAALVDSRIRPAIGDRR